VAVCQQEDLLISRLELLVEPMYADLAQSVVTDIAKMVLRALASRINPRTS